MSALLLLFLLYQILIPYVYTFFIYQDSMSSTFKLFTVCWIGVPFLLLLGWTFINIIYYYNPSYIDRQIGSAARMFVMILFFCAAEYSLITLGNWLGIKALERYSKGR